MRLKKDIFTKYLPGAVVGVLHVGDADGGVADPVVHHRVHRHRHAVLGQHLTFGFEFNNHTEKFPIDCFLTSCGGTPNVIVLRSTF